MKTTKTAFGTTPENQTISLFRLENASGAYVEFLDYGCRIMSICVPDKKGNLTDVALGLENLDTYLNDDASLGAIVGRFANRIANGRFSLNGKEYQLAVNNGPNHLHGGPTGYGQRIWNGKFSDNKLIFTRTSPAGEEGYPGTLNLSITYGWSEDNELSISYEATTDADTILNLTNHAYFNLNGHGSGTVLNHELRIDADSITELNENQVPTGKYIPVEGTPFDFREAKEIGQDINADNEQLKYGNGYDHNFAIDKDGDGVELVATAYCKESGIKMEVFTDAIGIQLYTANFIDGNIGKGNIRYQDRAAFCLETQYFPNSINEPNFVRPVFAAGEVYETTTVYKFS